MPIDKKVTGQLLDRITLPAGKRLSLKDPVEPGLECRIGSRGRSWTLTTKPRGGPQQKTKLDVAHGPDEIDDARQAARIARTAIKAAAASLPPTARPPR